MYVHVREYVYVHVCMYVKIILSLSQGVNVP
jgi:hypothetical protein